MRTWLLRLVVSAAILGTLLAFVSFGQLWLAMREVSLAVWVGAVLCFLAGHAVSAWKWRMLMVTAAPARGIWLRAHFAGLVANLCLPGIAGGDVVRAAWVMRRVDRSEDVAVASLADRAIDCASLLVLAGAGAFWLGRMDEAARRFLFLAASLGTVGLTLTLFALVLLERRGLGGRLGRVVSAVNVLMRRPLLPGLALLLSLAVQGTFIAVNAWLGMAAGVNVAPAVWLFAWPLAKLAALVPISLAGLGVREAALVALMRPFGADAAAVMASGLLWQGVLMASGLVGWLASQVLLADQPAGS
jgi:uncharacterized membrane protein YbhN (UPF0104 family)